MLKVENISYHIGRHKILNGICAEFVPGEFNVILGPNGSGKSSFLKIFSGEISAYEGSVIYLDRELRHIKKDELARCRAVMSQQPELSFPLSVEEVVLMGRYPHFSYSPNKKDLDICDEVMKKMNIEAFRSRNYLTLSGGEKQRVQFARVLAQVWEKPSRGNRYLFLDEPLTSLDIKYQVEFLQLAKSFLDSDTIVIAILHDINLAAQYGDQLYFLKEGRLVAQGSPGTVVNAALVEQVFEIGATVWHNEHTHAPIVLHHSNVQKMDGEG